MIPPGVRKLPERWSAGLLRCRHLRVRGAFHPTGLQVAAQRLTVEPGENLREFARIMINNAIHSSQPIYDVHYQASRWLLLGKLQIIGLPTTQAAPKTPENCLVAFLTVSPTIRTPYTIYRTIPVDRGRQYSYAVGDCLKPTQPHLGSGREAPKDPQKNSKHQHGDEMVATRIPPRQDRR